MKAFIMWVMANPDAVAGILLGIATALSTVASVINRLTAAHSEWTMLKKVGHVIERLAFLTHKGHKSSLFKAPGTNKPCKELGKPKEESE